MKNCSTCYWNVGNLCESSDWKSGKPIANPDHPECGYLRPTSMVPTGYRAKLVPLNVSGQTMPIPGPA